VIQDLSGSWCIKGTRESTLVMDSPVPLMHHDPERSWITDPDHSKGTQPKLISLQNQQTVYIRFANPSRGARQLGWASCLTSPGRVALASGATFLHINALARLTGTTREVSSIT